MNLKKSIVAMGVTCAFGLAAQSAIAALDPIAIKTRQRFFGLENVDAATGDLRTDKVVFAWLSNSSFAASIGGRVVLMDTGIDRLETTPGRTTFVIQDVVNLAPEAIFLGHGHSDQANNAAYIAGKTGATIYATPETCDVVRSDFTRIKATASIQGNADTKFDAAATLKCTELTTRGSGPAQERVRITALDSVACINVIRHLHSTAVATDSTIGKNTVPITVDPRDAEIFPVGVSLKPTGTALQAGQMDITSGGDGVAGAAASLIYHVTMRGGTNFSFAWHDTTGPMKEGVGLGWAGLPSDGARLKEALEKLPPADVDLGAVPSEDIANNGMRDLILYQQSLRPLIFYPAQTTAGVGSPESTSVPLFAAYLKQLALMSISRSDWADIRWTTDPMSYAHPMAFSIDNPNWARSGKAQGMTDNCGAIASDGGAATVTPEIKHGGGAMGLAAVGMLMLGAAAAGIRRLRSGRSR